MKPKPRPSTPVFLSVFAALCLFAALTSFVTGFGHLKLGKEKYHTEETELRITSGQASGDPMIDKTEREVAAIDDREEVSHGQFSIGVGLVLLIPAVVLGLKGRTSNRNTL